MTQPGARSIRSARWLPAVVLVLAVTGLTGGVAQAQNAAFQNYFFTVCSDNPLGPLGAACNVNPTLPGDLSSDSQESMNPSQFLALNQAALARARLTNKQIQDRLENRRARSAAATRVSLGLSSWIQQDTETAGGGSSGGTVSPEVSRWAVFGQGSYENLDRDETTLERGGDADRTGFGVGLDFRYSARGVFGALLTYEDTDWEFDSSAPGVNFVPPADDGKIDGDSTAITLYVSHNIREKIWLDGSIGFGETENDLTRNAVFQDTGRIVPQTDITTRAEADSDDLTAAVGLGRDYYSGAHAGSFYGRVSYSDSDVESFLEAPTGFGMGASSENLSSLLGTLGWRGSRAFGVSWGVLIPHIRVEYEHEFDDDAPTSDAFFILDTASNIYLQEGDDPDTDYVNAATGLVIVMPRGWQAFIDAEFLLGHSFLDRQRFTAGLRKEF